MGVQSKYTHTHIVLCVRIVPELSISILQMALCYCCCLSAVNQRAGRATQAQHAKNGTYIRATTRSTFKWQRRCYLRAKARTEPMDIPPLSVSRCVRVSDVLFVLVVVAAALSGSDSFIQSCICVSIFFFLLFFVSLCTSVCAFSRSRRCSLRVAFPAKGGGQYKRKALKSF